MQSLVVEGPEVPAHEATQDRVQPFWPDKQSLICEDASRFARSTLDAAVHKAELKKRGIKILYLLQQFQDDIYGQLIEHIMEVIDEFWAKQQAEKTFNHMRTNTERKYSNGGKPPFEILAQRVPIGGVGRDGRPREKVVWKPDPNEAGAVKYAFEQRLQGKGPDQIARELSRAGCKTRAGKKLTANYVYNWFRLHHDTYAGRMVWNKFRREGTRTIRKPREQWIIVPDAFEPIVPPNVSDRVHALVRQEDRSMPRPSNWTNKPYLATELLRCAECGFSLNANKSGGLNYAYYACTTAKKRHDCEHTAYYRTDLVDEKVLDIACKNVLTRRTLEQWIGAINDRIRRSQDQHNFAGERKQLLDLRSDAEARKKRLVEAIASGRLPFTSVADGIDAEDKRIAQIGADLEDLEALQKRKPVAPAPEAIDKTLSGLHDVLKSRAPAKIKSMLRAIIEKIDVTKDGRFTVVFDKSKVLAEAGVPNSFAFNGGLRDGHGEGDGARTRNLLIDNQLL